MNRRVGVILAALLMARAVRTQHLRPDRTPGQAKPTTKEAVCSVPWKPDTSAMVPSSVWRAVLDRYHLRWEDRGNYFPDLLIPSALGGIPSVDNVWPQPKVGPFNVACKDQIEHRVYDQLCAGIPIAGLRLQHLPEAQQKAGITWYIDWQTCRP